MNEEPMNQISQKKHHKVALAKQNGGALIEIGVQTSRTSVLHVEKLAQYVCCHHRKNRLAVTCVDMTSTI
jgi:hypothetical protein